jgi:hypothetical protein
LGLLVLVGSYSLARKAGPHQIQISLSFFFFRKRRLPLIRRKTARIAKGHAGDLS